MIDRWIVDNDPSPTYPIYTRGNIGEVFPLPVTPLTWTLGAIPAAELGWRDALVRFGAFRPDEFSAERIEVLGCFGGYGFLNVSISRILGVRTPGLTPEQVDYSFWGDMPEVPPYEARPGDEDAERTAAVGATLQWILTATELPELVADQELMGKLRAHRPEMSALSDAELVSYSRDLVPELRRMFASHLFITYCSTVPLGIIQTVCASLGDPTMAMRLVAGIGHVDSAAPASAMWDLGRLVAGSAELTEVFDAGIDDLFDRIMGMGGVEAADFASRFGQFLYDFGSRGPNEWETSSPSWEVKPDLALAAIDRMRFATEDQAPTANHDALVADREALGAEVASKLESDPQAQGQFLAAMSASGIFLGGRERTKTNVIRLVNETRVTMMELGRRMVDRDVMEQPEDFAMLHAEELDQFVANPDAFRATIAERRADYDQLFDLEPPFVVNGTVPPLSEWRRRNRTSEPAAPGSQLTGIPGCPGLARGRARVILDPNDPTSLEPGDVLIAPVTDPAWTPLFVPAAAVVVDVGAQISHAVIVSREMGIPCVVSVIDATRRIPDGAMVTVDGTAGTVTLD